MNEIKDIDSKISFFIVLVVGRCLTKNVMKATSLKSIARLKCCFSGFVVDYSIKDSL